MAKLKTSHIRELIRKLNRLDLSSVEYSYIKSLVEKLFSGGFHGEAFNLKEGQRLYRGVAYSSKPTETSYLGAPPAELVKDFQRCNQPHSPMFYCSADPAAVFYELGVKKGDTVYLSKWSVHDNNFYINPIISQLDDKYLYPALEIIFTYFETVFAQPIHEVFSHQYKITAAITELLTARDIAGDVCNRQMGGLSFPSVAHPNRSENLVLYPDIVDTCLSLDYVEEVQIIKVVDKVMNVEYSDISSDFSNNKINWSGRPKQWNIASGNSLTFTAELDGWVARDSQGNVITPS